MKKIVKKISESDVKTDKNDNNYKSVAFSTNGVEIIDGVQVFTTPKINSVNLFEKSYLPSNKGAEDFGYSQAIGSAFLGDIVTMKVQTPYSIPDAKVEGGERIVDTYTTVVFGDTSAANWETVVRSAFRSKGHPIEGDMWTPTVANEAVKAADANLVAG